MLLCSVTNAEGVVMHDDDQNDQPPSPQICGPCEYPPPDDDECLTPFEDAAAQRLRSEVLQTYVDD